MLRRLIKKLDAAASNLHRRITGEQPGLLGFMFHSLFDDGWKPELQHIDPRPKISVRQFKLFVEYYLAAGYQFVSPEDIAEGLTANAKYAAITFDDGYFNNSLALPLLERFQIPATFFVCSDHVQTNRCFWWDVLYRESVAAGESPAAIFREGEVQKSLRTEEIEARLEARFGCDAFHPRGRMDRPFTASELHDFASSRYVHVGNHTAHHAILPNYSPEMASRQVGDAQEHLNEMTGRRPMSIAYPNGGLREDVVGICREHALTVGFTTQPGKNRLPIDGAPEALLKLSRFTLAESLSIESQCRQFRSDLQVLGAARRHWG